MRVRRHFFFSGRVQGVGFRWKALRAARDLGLTGWVENLWDGRVEMEAQGEEAAIRRLLAALEEDRHIAIEETEARSLPLLEGEREFRLRGS